MRRNRLYHELLRPQFHFTAREKWLNDPNGLVYYGGEYHLFFQRHAAGMTWGPMRWGHAVSPDLVHWRQLADALLPEDEREHVWSGSAVVDWGNTSGLQHGREAPIIAFFTSLDPSPSSSRPAAQRIAFSGDRGRTWARLPGPPALPHIEGANRDPRVLWHEPTQTWIMALYLDRSDFALFGSRDMRSWEKLHDVRVPGASECPDFFELPMDDNPEKRMWTFWAADGRYLLGDFDGRRFTPSAGPFLAEQGPNGYAGQTWSDIPREDGRRIQVSWMRGGSYPYMPFNQQMSFPVALTLRDGPGGVRLCRAPVREIERLWRATRTLEGRSVAAGGKLVPEVEGDLFDIDAVVRFGAGVESFTVRVHGNELRYLSARGAFSYLGREVTAPVLGGRCALRLLVDRTSLELFSDGGRTSASFCFLPSAWDVPLEITAAGGEVHIELLVVRELASAWP